MTRRAGSDVRSTPESAWAAARPWADLPVLDLPVGRRVCVVSAHPDDDVLAVGGLVQRLAATNTLTVVVVTDGEASHPDSPTTRPAALAARRRDESDAALAALAVAPEVIHRLGLPDGALSERPAALDAALTEVVTGHDVVLAPWRRDGHPDHEAVGQACARTADGATTCWEFPVWAWRWARPGTTDLPWARARAHRPSREERDRKRRAIGCFTSQVEPLSSAAGDEAVLDAGFLAHVEREVEVVLT